MQKTKVFIDCDPGIDDALALLLALCHPNVSVVGIGVNCGNVPVELGVKNVLHILELTGQVHVPVYAGAEKPLQRNFVSAQDTHGENGLGEIIFAQPMIKAQKMSASEAILCYAKADTTLLTLAPLTNVALALQKNPKVLQSYGKVISMGGAFRTHGNCSQVAEYNYWCDPEAAEYVYANAGRVIEMVGLDVTRAFVLHAEAREKLKNLNNPLAEFAYDITGFYQNFHQKQENLNGCVLNDVLAVAYLIDENLCAGFLSHVDIVCQGKAMGQSLVDVGDFYKQSPNALILQEVRADDAMQLFWKTCFNTDYKILKI
jgi:purine nucleosidase